MNEKKNMTCTRSNALVMVPLRIMTPHILNFKTQLEQERGESLREREREREREIRREIRRERERDSSLSLSPEREREREREIRRERKN